MEENILQRNRETERLNKREAKKHEKVKRERERERERKRHFLLEVREIPRPQYYSNCPSSMERVKEPLNKQSETRIKMRIDSSRVTFNGRWHVTVDCENTQILKRLVVSGLKTNFKQLKKVDKGSCSDIFFSIFEARKSSDIETLNTCLFSCCVLI